MKNGTPLWHEAHFQVKVKMHKTPCGRSNFGSSDEKWHAAVARSTFPSQNAHNTTIAEQFLKVRCPKSKNRTPPWRQAHLSVKMCQAPQRGTNFGSFDPEKLHAAVARSTFVSQNAQNTTCSDHFLKVRCPKIARSCGAKRICASKCTKHLHFAAF